MANLQVKNVPEALHQRLRDHVGKEGGTLSQFVLQAIEKELALDEWQTRLNERLPTNLGVSAADLLREVRDERDGQ
jgi:plasmid stability protein